MPLVVPANQRASVCACVQKNPQFAVAAADEEKRPPRYVPAPVVARVLDFGFVAQVQPASVEDPLLLHPKNFERRHGGAMDSKYAFVRIVYDQIFRVEHRASLVDFLESRTLGRNRVLSYSTVQRRGKDGLVHFAPWRLCGKHSGVRRCRSSTHDSTSAANSSSGLTTRGERPCS